MCGYLSLNICSMISKRETPYGINPRDGPMQRYPTNYTVTSVSIKQTQWFPSPV